MLRVPVAAKPRKLKGAIIGSGSGPSERIKMLQIHVARLINEERIEGREDRMDETRGYAEKLIALAVEKGPNDMYTRTMAKKWLQKESLVNKLFNVLVPRYRQSQRSFTSTYTLPAQYPGTGRFDAVLELKGHPYIPVVAKQRDKSQLLTNILISAARREYGAAAANSYLQSADVHGDSLDYLTTDTLSEASFKDNSSADPDQQPSSTDHHSNQMGSDEENLVDLNTLNKDNLDEAKGHSTDGKLK